MAGIVSSTYHGGDAVDFSYEPVGAHIHVASAGLAAVYEAVKPAGATGLLAQNTGTQSLRFTLDGTDPAAAFGFVLFTSRDQVIIPCPGAAIEFIREADGAALDAQWVK